MLSAVVVLHSAENKKDTVRVYRLGELTIRGYETIHKAQPVSSSIGFRAIQEADAASASELSYILPAANIRTNSRGEALLFIRGGGERQLGLFLDGASINIPWDNRLDLNLVPTDIIGKMTVNKNSNSILAGANILGGLLNITTYEKYEEGIGGSVRLQYTDGGGSLVSLVNDGRFGKFNYVANVSYSKSEGLLLSQKSDNTMRSQRANSNLISNTDFSRLNFYLRGEYELSEMAKLGLSYSMTDAEKGVASEFNLDAADARFWRYSDWNRNFITLNGEFDLSKNITFRTNFWLDMFRQQIDAYSDSTYSDISSVQNDEDFTFGNRISLEWQIFDNQFVSYAFNSFYSEHQENIDDIAPADFSQFTYSTGIEYRALVDLFEINGGLTYDGNITPKTGVFTENEGLSYSDFGLFLGGKYMISENSFLFANLGRRSRFPTMREAYSGALGKFTVNPDLGAETGILTDVGLDFNFYKFNANLNAFYNMYDELIVRITDPNNSKKKKRVNLAEALSYGIEFNLALVDASPVIFAMNLLWMKNEGKENGKELEHIEYKPELSASLKAGYKFPFALKVQAEFEYTGRQYGIDAARNGEFAEIESSVVTNLRIAKTFIIYSKVLELFVRINNISDEFYISQIGIPDPGRTFSCGLTFRY